MRKTPAAQPTLFALPSEPPTARCTPRARPAPVPAVKADAKEIKVKKVTPAKKTAAVKTRAVKTIPVQSVPAPASSVRVFMESGAGGQAWRMSGKHAVAYLRDAALAGELLATDTRHLAKAAMAVYYDRKGKAFAWQVRFDAERWDEVVARLG